MAKGIVSAGPFLRGTVGSRVITPESLPGMELYLLSTDVAGGHGTVVATWPDRSGNARDATQAVVGNRPTVILPGSPNGTKLIRFVRGNAAPPASWMGAGAIGPSINANLGMTFYAWGAFGLGDNAGFGLGNVIFTTNHGRYNLAWRLGTAIGAPQIDNRRGYRDQGSISEGTVVSGAHSFAAQSSLTGTIATVYYPPNSVGDPVGTPRGGPGQFYVNGNPDGENTSPRCWRGNAGTMPTNYNINASDAIGSLNGEADYGAILWFSRAHDAATVAAISAYFERVFRL